MSIIQSPFSQPEEYFTNNGQGYEKYDKILLLEYNIEIRIYCNKLTYEQLEEIKKLISKGIKNYFKNCTDLQQEISENLTIENYYIFEEKFFDDKKDYRHLGTIIDYGWEGYLTLGTEKTLKQSPFTKPEEYFIDSITFSPSDYKIDVKCFYNILTPTQLDKIKNSISAVFDDFFKVFLKAKHASKKLETVCVYFFNNGEDYDYLGTEIFNLRLGKSLGIAQYIGDEECQSLLFISDPNNSVVLKHELAHALTYYATSGRPPNAPSFLMEGIARYFEGNSNLKNLTPEECSELTYQKLVELNPYQENNLLVYRAGHAIVKYLQENYPGAISEYFTNYRKSKQHKSKLFKLVSRYLPHFFNNWKLQKAIEPLRAALRQPERIEKWLSTQFSQEKQLSTQPPQKTPLSTRPPQEKQLSTQPPQKTPLSTRPPQEKPLSTQPPQGKSLSTQSPQGTPLSTQLPQETGLSTPPLQEKRLSTSFSRRKSSNFNINSLIEMMLGYKAFDRHQLTGRFTTNSQQNFKISIVISVEQSQRSRYCL